MRERSGPGKGEVAWRAPHQQGLAFWYEPTLSIRWPGGRRRRQSGDGGATRWCRGRWGATNRAHRLTTSPQPLDPATLAAICAADILEHLPFPDPSVRISTPASTS